MKRTPITDRMRWQSLVENYGIDCWICGGRLTLADEIQFDHYVEVADNGEHTPRNIKPVHRDPCHKRKSAKAESQRSRIDRLEKELHGLPKRKRAKRPMKSRGFGKKHRPFPSRPLRKPSSELT